MKDSYRSSVVSRPPSEEPPYALRVPQSLAGIVLFLGLFVQASAQPVQETFPSAGTFDPSGLTVLSARAAAMGSAFTGVADDSSALFSNPAGLAFLSRGEIALLSDLSWVDTFQETAVVGFPVGRWGGVGLAGSYHGYGTLEGRDVLGSLAPSYGADQIEISAGLGLALFEECSLGAALHGTQETIAGSASTFFTPDFGILWKPLKGFKLGLDYTGPGGSPPAGPLVSVFKGGASWETPFSSSTRFLAAFGAALQSNSMNYFQGGLEFSYRSVCFLRGGYQAAMRDNGYVGLSGFTFGAGLALSEFHLDYAFLPSGDLGSSHRFTVAYTFESPFESKDKGGLGRGSLPGKTLKTGTVNAAAAQAAPMGNSPIAGGTMEKQPAAGPKDGREVGGQANTASPANAGGETAVPSSPAQGALMGGAPRIEKASDPKDRLTVRFNIPADNTAQGEAMESQGRHSDAIRLFQEALKKDPQNAVAWWDMGNVYYKLGQKNYALQCYEKVLKLRPADKSFGEWLERYKGQQP